MATPLSFPQPERDAQLSSSVQIARRLIAHDMAPGPSDPERIVVGLRKTCARVSGNLRSALGTDGCNALLTRALVRVEGQHPLIADLRRSSDGEIAFDGLAKSVDHHGGASVTAAIEALLAALIDILVRLIGEDMAVRLTAADAAAPPVANGGASRS